MYCIKTKKTGPGDPVVGRINCITSGKTIPYGFKGRGCGCQADFLLLINGTTAALGASSPAWICTFSATENRCALCA